MSVQSGDQAAALPDFALDPATVLHLGLRYGLGVVLCIEFISKLDLAVPVQTICSIPRHSCRPRNGITSNRRDRESAGNFHANLNLRGEPKGADRALHGVPRYFFHLYNDVEAADPDGVELPNAGAARMVALQNARFTVAETIKAEGRFVGDHRIDIEDEDGKVLDTIYFRDAVTIESH